MALLYQTEDMKRNILIIEDQLTTRKLLSHYLSAYYNVVEKENAIEALTWLSQGHCPDAIIVDILMPEMTGIEFLNQIGSTMVHVPPVLVLSGIENSTEKMKCFHLGARDYIVKPFNPEELRVRVQNAMASQTILN